MCYKYTGFHIKGYFYSATSHITHLSVIFTWCRGYFPPWAVWLWALPHSEHLSVGHAAWTRCDRGAEALKGFKMFIVAFLLLWAPGLTESAGESPFLTQAVPLVPRVCGSLFYWETKRVNLSRARAWVTCSANESPDVQCFCVFLCVISLRMLVNRLRWT